MYLIVPQESNTSEGMASTIEVSHWPFVIGRGANADLQLDLPGVWERHIALDQAENGEIRFSCSDQSEVWLNGKAVSRWTPGLTRIANPPSLGPLRVQGLFRALGPMSAHMGHIGDLNGPRAQGC